MKLDGLKQNWRNAENGKGRGKVFMSKSRVIWMGEYGRSSSDIRLVSCAFRTVQKT